MKEGAQTRHRVALVTPAWVGWTQQALLSQELALLWAQQKYIVTVLLTTPLTEIDRSFSLYPYIHLVCLADFWQPPQALQYGGEHRSQAVFEWLKSQKFDTIVFHEQPADGFISIQAKKTGLAFAETTLAVILRAPDAWQREQLQQWPTDPYQAIKHDFTTRYCCEHADQVWALSEKLLDWIKSAHWSLSQVEQRGVPVIISEALTQINIQGLIFYGSLAPCHGLEVLFQALASAFEQEQWPELTHLVLVEAIPLPPEKWNQTNRLINTFSQAYPAIKIDTVLHSTFPFKPRNYGYGVLLSTQYLQIPHEAVSFLGTGLPVLAPKSMAPQINALKRWQFEAKPASLQHSFQQLRRHPKVPASHQKWQKHINRCWQLTTTATHQTIWHQPPLVSVCIPFFNHGAYLPALLDSLAASTYPAYEVIVVNDGSTDLQSLGVFEQERARFSTYPWLFLSKTNSGPGATRNFAAYQAQGEYLVFMDADNVAKPEMLSCFMHGMQASQVDVLTCYFGGFRSPSPPLEGEPEMPYRPLGPCLELALFENVLGDSNMCIKHSVFEALGGFITDNNSSCEDWELLVQLLLQGYRHDVIPHILFWYRILPTSRSRTHSQYYSHRRIMDCFTAQAPVYLQRLLCTLAVPLFREYKVHLWPLLRNQTLEVKQLQQLLAQQEAQLRQYRLARHTSSS